MLIVEDEPIIAMDIEAVLGAEGLSVEYCASREGAMKLIAATTPSTAILDFHLKDGEALTTPLSCSLGASQWFSALASTRKTR